MAIKKTLLEIVQDILNDLDSENVDSLGDSEEALQVASIVQTTFYNIISTRDIASNEKLLVVTPYSDSNYPTSFIYADTVKEVKEVWYNVGTLAAPEYRKQTFLEASDFFRVTDNLSDDYEVISEPISGILLKIRTNSHPTYFTSFDDTSLMFDSYDNDVDSTLQASKVRALGSVFPTFTIDDSFVPDIAPTYFPYLIAESKSMAFDILKGGTTQKVDQAARRQKAYIQNDKYRTDRPDQWSTYGRK